MGEILVQGRIQQAGHAFDQPVSRVSLAGVNVVEIHHHVARTAESGRQGCKISEKPAEERRIQLRAAEILRAEIIQISAVGQRILRDEINVAAVIGRIHRLIFGRDKAFAENHVGRAEPAGVGAAKENGVARHLRINEIGVRAFHHLCAQLGVVAEFPVRPDKRRREHVVPEPVAEPVVALLALRPVG